jgi:hypothetical protein
VGLTKRGRNDIVDVLERNGVNPAQCDLDNSRAAQIVHESTKSEFKIVEFPSPGREGFHLWLRVPDGLAGNFLAASWDDVLEQLGVWAAEVRYVAETPDLWAELKRVPQILAATEGMTSNAIFTADEQAEIRQKLDAIKNLVRENFELTNEQLSAVEKTLDEVKGASARLGRKDWRLLLYGAFLNLFLTDAIPPSVIQTVLATAVRGIAHMFGVGDPPSMITT